MAQVAPFSKTLFNSSMFNFRLLSLPTPDGTLSKILAKISFIFGITSSLVKLEVNNLTPQLMSKPIPPGEIPPCSASSAATPPMEKP